jgi:hypothetical protein
MLFIYLNLYYSFYIFVSVYFQKINLFSGDHFSTQCHVCGKIFLYFIFHKKFFKNFKNIYYLELAIIYFLKIFSYKNFDSGHKPVKIIKFLT